MKTLEIKYGVKALVAKYNNYGDYNRVIIPPTVTKIIGSLNNLQNLEEVIFLTEIDKNGNIKGIQSINNSFNNCNNLDNIIFQNENDVKIENSFNKSKVLKKYIV